VDLDGSQLPAVSDAAVALTDAGAAAPDAAAALLDASAETPDAAETPTDAGDIPPDAAVVLDAGEATPDASAPADASMPDAAAPDASMPDAAATVDAALPDPCADVMCPANAACVAQPTARCVCNEGYTGTLCDTCSAGFVVATDGDCIPPVKLALPMDNQDGGYIDPPVIGFDNDPDDAFLDTSCRAHDGRAFPACYDQHSGTDFMLNGGFDTMDNGSTHVLAAADGVVVYVRDGEFDRCRLDIFQGGVVCPGHDTITPANRIILEHRDGKRTSYLHLKKDSVLVALGDVVLCGQHIALVGSSGNSSAPHLHMTLTDAEGQNRDPYSGVGSQPETHWVEQDAPNGLPGTVCQ